METREMKLINEVYAHNTRPKNMICCIEEMSELTKVLTKELRNDPKFTTEKLAEELAHVLLMCNVIAYDYGIEPDIIYWNQQDAVRRMKEEK